MKRIGFIGTGSMGKIIIDSFLEAHAMPPANVTITNRSLHKAHEVASRHKGVTVVEDAQSVIEQSDWIFLCVRPLQMIPLLEEVDHILTKDKTLISITSPILVEELEEIISSHVVRFIPSIVNRGHEGPSLVTFGKTMSEEMKEEFLTFFQFISRPEVIEDRITRVASDIGCCGPAFLSFLVENIIQAAVDETNISKQEATNIMESMLIGYGELLKQKHFTLETLRERVTVPGGVTGVGLEALKEGISTKKVFHQLFQKTHEKFDEDRFLVQKQLTIQEKEQ
ncbi:late competence protein ComER [Evansella tamaricis]|uniref:late competence protein ComER n=1 Tax=Evansella tamaricis TaxID=2069301 RepID=UPI001FE61FAC|nr:late competence protein ComER [Evansella tamaricis]